MAEPSVVPAERIERAILMFRGHKVMLDSDLASLYGVQTKVLNQAVTRNIERSPEDFMFQLIEEEAMRLRSQIVTLKPGRGRHRKYLPYAFTEQGVAMLSSVLRSQGAVQVNIEIMRAFVRLRELIATNKDLARKLEELEKKYDAQFKVVFDAIRQLMPLPERPRRSKGFQMEEQPLYRLRRRRRPRYTAGKVWATFRCPCRVVDAIGTGENRLRSAPLRFRCRRRCHLVGRRRLSLSPRRLENRRPPSWISKQLRSLR